MVTVRTSYDMMDPGTVNEKETFKATRNYRLVTYGSGFKN